MNNTVYWFVVRLIFRQKAAEEQKKVQAYNEEYVNRRRKSPQLYSSGVSKYISRIPYKGVWSSSYIRPWLKRRWGAVYRMRSGVLTTLVVVIVL